MSQCRYFVSEVLGKLISHKVRAGVLWQYSTWDLDIYDSVRWLALIDHTLHGYTQYMRTKHPEQN